MAKNALGKGLGALLSENDLAQDEIMQDGKIRSDNENVVQEIDLDLIKPNPYQPRKDFDENALQELADSISEHGVIEPIIVTEDGEGGFFVIGGERRCRASKISGLKKIPAVVKKYSQQKMLEIALIENIQREDLNALEEAKAYQCLMEMSNLNQEEVAKRVGKSRSAVANSLRLLKLPEDMQRSLSEGKISAGHARALLSVNNASDQQILFARIIGSNLSVRDAEKNAQEMNDATSMKSPPDNTKPKSPNALPNKDPDLISFEQKLIEKFGTKVMIKGSLQKGSIQLDYFSEDDLERLYDLLIGD